MVEFSGLQQSIGRQPRPPTTQERPLSLAPEFPVAQDLHLQVQAEMVRSLRPGEQERKYYPTGKNAELIWQHICDGQESPLDSENRYRGYLQVDIQDIPLVVEIMHEVGQARLAQSKSTEFKWLIAYRNDPNINLAEYFDQNGQRIGRYDGLPETDPRIAVYAEKGEDILEILDTLSRDPRWAAIEAKRAKSHRRPGTSAYIREDDAGNEVEFRSLNYNGDRVNGPKRGYSEDEANDPQWREIKGGTPTMQLGDRLVEIPPITALTSEAAATTKVEATPEKLRQNLLSAYDEMLKIIEPMMKQPRPADIGDDKAWVDEKHAFQAAKAARQDKSYQFDETSMRFTVTDAERADGTQFEVQDYLPITDWMVKQVEYAGEKNPDLLPYAKALRDAMANYSEVHSAEEMEALIRREARLLSWERGTKPEDREGQKQNWLDGQARLNKRQVVNPEKLVEAQASKTAPDKEAQPANEFADLQNFAQQVAARILNGMASGADDFPFDPEVLLSIVAAARIGTTDRALTASTILRGLKQAERYLAGKKDPNTQAWYEIVNQMLSEQGANLETLAKNINLRNVLQAELDMFPNKLRRRIEKGAMTVDGLIGALYEVSEDLVIASARGDLKESGQQALRATGRILDKLGLESLYDPTTGTINFRGMIKVINPEIDDIQLEAQAQYLEDRFRQLLEDRAKKKEGQPWGTYIMLLFAIMMLAQGFLSEGVGGGQKRADQ